MSGRLGHKGGATTAEGKKRISDGLATYRRERRAPILRVAGRIASVEDVKTVLKNRLPGYLDQLHALSQHEDPRVALEATRYLTDRILGKPTERQIVQEEAPDYGAIIAVMAEGLPAGAGNPDETLVLPGPDGETPTEPVS